MQTKQTIRATALTKKEENALDELRQIVHGMIFTRFIKRAYRVEKTALLYVPYVLDEYQVHNAGKTKKARRMGHVFISTEVGSGMMKSFADIDKFELSDVEVADENMAHATMDVDAINERSRKELVLKVLPQNLKSWRVYDVELVSSTQMFRPLWIMQYKLFGRTRFFKTFGDCYNM